MGGVEKPAGRSSVRNPRADAVPSKDSQPTDGLSTQGPNGSVVNTQVLTPGWRPNDQQPAAVANAIAPTPPAKPNFPESTPKAIVAFMGSTAFLKLSPDAQDKLSRWVEHGDATATGRVLAEFRDLIDSTGFEALSDAEKVSHTQYWAEHAVITARDNVLPAQIEPVPFTLSAKRHLASYEAVAHAWPADESVLAIDGRELPVYLSTKPAPFIKASDVGQVIAGLPESMRRQISKIEITDSTLHGPTWVPVSSIASGLVAGIWPDGTLAISSERERESPLEPLATNALGQLLAAARLRTRPELWNGFIAKWASAFKADGLLALDVVQSLELFSYLYQATAGSQQLAEFRELFPNCARVLEEVVRETTPISPEPTHAPSPPKAVPKELEGLLDLAVFAALTVGDRDKLERWNLGSVGMLFQTNRAALVELLKSDAFTSAPLEGKVDQLHEWVSSRRSENVLGSTKAWAAQRPQPAMLTKEADLKAHRFERGGSDEATHHKAAFDGARAPIDIVVATSRPPSGVAYSAEQIAEVLGGIPPEVRNLILSVEMAPRVNEGDARWGAQYGDDKFTSLAGAHPNGTLIIFPIKFTPGPGVMRADFIHEAAHMLSKRLWGEYQEPNASGGWAKWVAAAQKDQIHVSAYARCGVEEDFAETFTQYQLVKDSEHVAEFAALYPERYKILRSLDATSATWPRSPDPGASN